MTAETQFRDAMQTAFGVALDFIPVGDSSIHRFKVPGDQSSTPNGWYVLFLDGIPSGCFGSWKAGGSQSWCSRQPTNPIEAELIRQRIEQARRQRETEQHQRQQATAIYARQLWGKAAGAAPNQSYLVAKQVKPYGLRQWGEQLLVPLYHAGQLVNLQRIRPDGGKRFLPGGRVKGCYSPLGAIQPGKPLYLCEGWATGATLHQHTGCPVACAMNAGNLLPAGHALRQRHPDLELIVAGDDDRQTEGNPGRTQAIGAAATLGCSVVFPAWPTNAPLNLSDFNDLSRWVVEDAV